MKPLVVCCLETSTEYCTEYFISCMWKVLHKKHFFPTTLMDLKVKAQLKLSNHTSFKLVMWILEYPSKRSVWIFCFIVKFNFCYFTFYLRHCCYAKCFCTLKSQVFLKVKFYYIDAFLEKYFKVTKKKNPPLDKHRWVNLPWCRTPPSEKWRQPGSSAPTGPWCNWPP